MKPPPSQVARFPVPCEAGEFELTTFDLAGGLVFALSRGSLPETNLLVRVQSACMLSESFLVNCCDCGDQLRQALLLGARESHFLLLYFREEEGRGVGLRTKVACMQTEMASDVDTVEAFARHGYGLDTRRHQDAAGILQYINGTHPVRLMTNNPTRLEAIVSAGIPVIERVPLLIDPPNEPCRRYLAAKKHKMGHILPHIA